MIDLKEKTDDIKELEIPEIKNENNEENIDNQQIVVTEKKSKKWIIISSLIIVIILLIFSTIFALINIGNKKIIKGILIENIDVSNLTIEEANSLLNEITDKEKENEIIFKYKEVETPITYEALEVEFDIKEKVEKAYQVGRGSNIIKNNQTVPYILEYNITKKEIYELYFYSGVVENHIKFNITSKDITSQIE